MPVVALGLGIGVRHERVAPLSVVGAAVCLGGARVIRQARASEERAAASPGTATAFARTQSSS
jgi:drug/metabolite transporter (DMT)-like permease